MAARLIAAGLASGAAELALFAAWRAGRRLTARPAGRHLRVVR